jgi:DNA-binding transcriptional LysR family regulator
MDLTQLRYVIQVVEDGSISRAATNLYISQPSLSNAIKRLENDLDIQVFIRKPRGIALTDEGQEFLGYARQVVEQADLLMSHYKGEDSIKRLFNVSSQHYAFVVEAFVTLLEKLDMSKYEVALKESQTHEIIHQVANLNSDIGVLFLNDFNRDVLIKLLDEKELTYTSLFKAKPHVFLSKTSPLAGRKSLSIEDLEPYPYLSYDQGTNNSFYFSEEILPTLKHDKSVIVTDRATIFNLMKGLDGYTFSTGISNSELNDDDIVSIPLDVDDNIEIVYILAKNHKLSQTNLLFIELLKEKIALYGFDIV